CVPRGDAVHVGAEMAAGRYVVTVDAADRKAEARALLRGYGGRDPLPADGVAGPAGVAAGAPARAGRARPADRPARAGRSGYSPVATASASRHPLSNSARSTNSFTVWISFCPAPNVTVGTPCLTIQFASSPPLVTRRFGTRPIARTA